MMSQDGFSSLPPTRTTIRGFVQEQTPIPNPNPNPTSIPAKRKRLPGTPDPDAEVIALSPKSLMSTNRFLCEICNKGFQRDQNLQLHRRAHNLPWKLKQKTNKEIRKKVYICPEKTCVHHDPSRALGDLTGIKKHFSRKHGEKKWKCEKCSKKYAVQSDWKAHSKICGTREYRCDCGTIFSRKDSFITHRAFCDALAEESSRYTTIQTAVNPNLKNELLSETINYSQPSSISQFSSAFRPDFGGSELQLWLDHANSVRVAGHSSGYFSAPTATSLPEIISPMFGSSSQMQWLNKYSSEGETFTGADSDDVSAAALARRIAKVEEQKKNNLSESMSCLYSNSNQQQGPAHMSATALLQKAAQMGSTISKQTNTSPGFGLMSSSTSLSSFNSHNQQNKNQEAVPKLFKPVSQTDHSSSSSSFLANSVTGRSNEANERSLTRDFLGVGGESNRPFLQHELAKFVSLGSAGAMDLSRYTGQDSRVP